MYSEIVHEHVSRPRNVGPLEGATHQGTAGVPGDGPYMILWFEVADGRILRAAYKTYGCIAAIACGSITTTLLTGLPVEKALRLNAQDIIRVLGSVPTTYLFDANGNRLTEHVLTDTTQYHYDDENRLVFLAAPVTERNTYTYDGDGRRRSLIERLVPLTTIIWDGDDYLGEY